MPLFEHLKPYVEALERKAEQVVADPQELQAIRQKMCDAVCRCIEGDFSSGDAILSAIAVDLDNRAVEESERVTVVP